MLKREGMYVVTKTEANRIRDECVRSGWKVLRLPAGISSKDEFFEGVRQTLPLDPPLESNRSWDALADSLWSGLDALSDENILIVWPDASRMEALAADEFAIANSILAEIPDSLADREATVGATKHLVVLQVH